MGRYQEAIAEMQKSMDLGGIDNRGNLGHMLAVSGRRGEAEKLLAQLLEEAKHKPVSPYNIARIYAGLGGQDEAFAWLEKAFAERDANFTNPGLKSDHAFNSLRSDQRFADLLRRIDSTPERTDCAYFTKSRIE